MKEKDKKPKKYKTTAEPQELLDHQFRPYDMWEAGTCPVCGLYYQGDWGYSQCTRCGQKLK